MADKSRPAEFDLDQKWDRVIDLGLRRVVYGTLTAGLASLILFRGASVRTGIIGLGAGFGAGSAYADSQREIHEILKLPNQKSQASQQ